MSRIFPLTRTIRLRSGLGQALYSTPRKVTSDVPCPRPSNRSDDYSSSPAIVGIPCYVFLNRRHQQTHVERHLYLYTLTLPSRIGTLPIIVVVVFCSRLRSRRRSLLMLVDIMIFFYFAIFFTVSLYRRVQVLKQKPVQSHNPVRARTPSALRM